MTFRKYYTDIDVIRAVKNNNSIAGVLRELGLVVIGGNYATIKRKIVRMNLDISHFTGRNWSVGLRLKDYENYKSKTSLKLQIIKERGYKCEKCGLEKWLNAPITLELHHKDGNSHNNKEENVELLCPNCHSFTKNWRKQK